MSVLTGPPEIDGYEFLEPLGSGGFAEVYLYEQQLPRRTVAVKVLRGDLGEQAAAAFLDEANVMAQLSAHPSIVTVYQAGILPDDRRPYLVMEHCPRGNLGSRFRTETFSVQEALAIGIQLAGAVETAHRAGVLHRDIKPENVLITSLNRPALTDFGVASRLGAAATGETSGMSVPWSPPEAIDGSWSGPPSDVYSLGATVYSLLAGRSPFESLDGANGVLDYAWRILHADLPPTGRPDVPESLEQALATAMARSPQGRYTSALGFARALQRVERELGLEVTSVDVLDNGFSASEAAQGVGLPLLLLAPEGTDAPPAQSSLPTMAAGLAALAAGPPETPAHPAEAPVGPPAGLVSLAAMAAEPAAAAPGRPDPAPPEPATPAASVPAAAEDAALPDITLVLSPSDAAALALETQPRSVAESLGFDPPPPSTAAPTGFAAPPAERGPVWPAVLVDLVLIGAVAGAAAVYLMLQQ